MTKINPNLLFLYRMNTPFKAMIYLLIAGIVACAYWAWTPDKDIEQLKAKYAQAPSAFITIAGTQVHYRDSGTHTAPVMALVQAYIHGTIGLRRWRKIIA